MIEMGAEESYTPGEEKNDNGEHYDDWLKNLSPQQIASRIDPMEMGKIEEVVLTMTIEHWSGTEVLEQ
jgi:hypothetical protein